MSAICERRWMLVHAAEKSHFFGPMSLDPTLIREKLFQGIDGDYNVSIFYAVKRIFKGFYNI
jgi:hypothetical protein